MDNDPENQDPEGQPQGGKTFTEDQVNALLQRERDKVYGRLDKSSQAQEELKNQLAELQKAEKSRAAAEAKARKDAEEAARKAAEAEMSAKELIDTRTRELQEHYKQLEQTWADQVQTMQQQMAAQDVILQKERQFAALQQYKQQVLAQHQGDIAPELSDYIDGNSAEEIDAAVAKAIEKTNSIVSGFQLAQQQARSQMPGTGTTGYTPTGPLEGGTAQQMTLEQLQAMGNKDYAKFRELPGMPGASQQQQGLFG